MKVVLNDCEGYFELSQIAKQHLAARKGWQLKRLNKQVTVYITTDGSEWLDEDLDRTDSDLIAIVEDLKEKADTHNSLLTIVEIPDDIYWSIQDTHGYECVAEKHRTWDQRGLIWSTHHES